MRATLRMSRILIAVALASVVASCDAATVPSYNTPGVETLTGSPDASSVNAAVLGLVHAERVSVLGYATTLGILGREMLLLTSNETRNVSEMLEIPLTPDRIIIDMGWAGTYRELLNAFTILRLVDVVPNYSAAQREAVKGFTKTFMAMAYIDQLRVRDTFGIVLEVDPDFRSLGPFVTRDEGFARAAQLLDEAKAHLSAGGSAFPFTLPSGYTGFNTPATFVRFNRAIKARMEVYRAGWQRALEALGESFISTSAGTRAALDAGVYNVYVQGEATNSLFDGVPANRVAVPTFLSDAQRRADGTVDLRASTKAQAGSVTLSLRGITSNLRITRYANNTASVPIIKNEELILLRAEANLALGNRASAIDDLNFVRVNSGGLAALPAGYAGDLVTEILYNRTYSLFYEYGHRWVDARRYGRLGQLPKVLAEHRIFPLVPLPASECSARPERPRGCTQVDGR